MYKNIQTLSAMSVDFMDFGDSRQLDFVDFALTCTSEIVTCT